MLIFSQQSWILSFSDRLLYLVLIGHCRSGSGLRRSLFLPQGSQYRRPVGTSRRDASVHLFSSFRTHHWSLCLRHVPRRSTRLVSWHLVPPQVPKHAVLISSKWAKIYLYSRLLLRSILIPPAHSHEGIAQDSCQSCCLIPLLSQVSFKLCDRLCRRKVDQGSDFR